MVKTVTWMSVLPQIAFVRGIRGCGHVSILTGYVSANGYKSRHQLEGIVPCGDGSFDVKER